MPPANVPRRGRTGQRDAATQTRRREGVRHLCRSQRPPGDGLLNGRQIPAHSHRLPASR